MDDYRDAYAIERKYSITENKKLKKKNKKLKKQIHNMRNCINCEHHLNGEHSNRCHDCKQSGGLFCWEKQK